MNTSTMHGMNNIKPRQDIYIYIYTVLCFIFMKWVTEFTPLL